MVLALRGKRQIGCVTSAERGILTTAAICMSATGHYIPPMLIFPRVRMTEQLKKGAPPDSLFSCNPTGWMNANEFCKWFDHFVQHTRPTAENPVLLLLDGHSSHTKNLAFVEKARSSNVTVISFPPHCTHKLQPLDVSYMASLKSHFSKAVESFMKSNPGKTVTINDVSELFGKAFLASATSTTAINGFMKTGIVPLNRFVFGEDDFAAADVSDVPLVTEGESADMPDVSPIPENEPVDVSSVPSTTGGARTDVQITNPFFGFDECQIGPSPSGQVIDGKIPMAETTEGAKWSTPVKATTQIPVQSAFKISPSEINPLPKMASRKRNIRSKKEKAANITSSPNRNLLKASMANKDINELQKQKRKASKGKAERSSKKRKMDLLVQDSLCDKCGCCFMLSSDGENWNKCTECDKWYHLCDGANCPSC